MIDTGNRRMMTPRNVAAFSIKKTSNINLVLKGTNKKDIGILPKTLQKLQTVDHLPTPIKIIELDHPDRSDEIKIEPCPNPHH